MERAQGIFAKQMPNLFESIRKLQMILAWERDETRETQTCFWAWRLKCVTWWPGRASKPNSRLSFCLELSIKLPVSCFAFCRGRECAGLLDVPQAKQRHYAYLLVSIILWFKRQCWWDFLVKSRSQWYRPIRKKNANEMLCSRQKWESVEVKCLKE